MRRLFDSIVEKRHLVRLNAYSRDKESISEDIRDEVLVSRFLAVQLSYEITIANLYHGKKPDFSVVVS